jgi:hypothetical protein
MEDTVPKPQQPELRRSDYGATSDDSLKIKASVQEQPNIEGRGGPIPADNVPGHHPEREQDKPDLDAFVQRAKQGGTTET